MADDGVARDAVSEATQREVDEAIRRAEQGDDGDDILVPD